MAKTNRFDPSDIFNVKGLGADLSKVGPTITKDLPSSALPSTLGATQNRINTALATFLGLPVLPKGLATVVSSLGLSSTSSVASAIGTAAEVTVLLNVIKALFGLESEARVSPTVTWLIISALKRHYESVPGEALRVDDRRYDEFLGVTLQQSEILRHAYESQPITADFKSYADDRSLPIWKRAAYSVATLRGTPSGDVAIENLTVKLASLLEDYGRSSSLSLRADQSHNSTYL